MWLQRTVQCWAQDCCITSAGGLQRTVQCWAQDCCIVSAGKHVVTEDCTVLGSGLLHHISRWVTEDCIVLGSGLLHHISSDEHRASMDQFFWDNLVKKERKPKFILTPADLTIFEKSSFLAVKKYQKAKTEEIKQLAATLSASEHLRCQRLTEVKPVSSIGDCIQTVKIVMCFRTFTFDSEAFNFSSFELFKQDSYFN
ncbi:hypothetical protein DPMN_174373 [Dreissena polymorpha]|uniref:Uncharacterized protein n=1 Tax=Dreissena polymorpha TaxID=45954 RepID=A0A9D4E6Z8_DREPO|nr:hypothetical protein DPMN_174373 [Dreissena polymorpha]